MKKVKIISISLLSGLILLSTNSLAIKGTVNAPSGLVLREKASKTSNPIATVEDKAVVEILEESGEWYKVKYNNDKGYLYAEFVNAQKEEKTEEPQETAKEEEETKTNANKDIDNNTQNSQKQKIKSDLKIYVIPSITANTLTDVKKGAEVTINYELNNWVNVTYGNYTGWARKYFINGENITVKTNNDKEENDTKEENKSNEAEENKNIENTKGYVNVSNSANIRKEASTSSEIINTLLRNTEVTIISEEGDFYKIQYQDITGYISKTLISEKPVAE